MSTELNSRRLTRGAVRLIDAAATPYGIDRYLELVNPTWSTGDIRARVVQAQRRTPDTVTITLRPNGHWSGFVAGQHSVVTVEIDGVRHSRCYSLASSAHAAGGTIEMTVKAHPGGTVSRYLVDHARPGLVVGLSPARGSFTLPDVRPARIALVSGGSGITPVMSMFRTLVDEAYTGPVNFLHYSRRPADNPYRHELATAPANVTVTSPFTSLPLPLGGHFRPEHLVGLDAATEVFVCGPAALRAAVRAHLSAQGWADRYHDEAFTLESATLESAAAPAGGTITFARSGRRVEDDGRTLLAQARAAGLSPRYGCAMGLCHTCTVPLTAGAVRHVATGGVTRADDATGAVPIQICIHAPAGDLAVAL